MILVQTCDVPGLISTLVCAAVLAAQRGEVDLAVEQDLEGLPGLAVHGIGLSDVKLLEERLVGRTTQRVIDAHVDRMAVPSQGQAVIKVGAGLVIFDLAGLDA